MAKFYTKGMRGILREKALTLKKKIQLYSNRKISQLTVADRILLSAGQLKEVDISPFTRQNIKERLPDVNPDTVSVQIQSMTINTPGHGACGEKYRKKCFERVDRGQYVLTPYGENLLEEIKKKFINGIKQHERTQSKVIHVSEPDSTIIMIERIYNFLKERPGTWFDDGEIQKKLGIKNRSQVNSRCRKLADEGKILRRRIGVIIKNSYHKGEFPEEPPESLIEEGEVQIIEIPTIKLKWNPWFSWEDFELDMRYSSNGVRVPSVSGVYEVKVGDSEERLTIGKASNLRMRVKQGLVKGKTPHSAGRRIRANEDLSVIFIRWATTDRPSCVEEELHKQYRKKFGRLPKYTLRT